MLFVNNRNLREKRNARFVVFMYMYLVYASMQILILSAARNYLCNFTALIT